jgi:hypothetical protein
LVSENQKSNFVDYNRQNKKNEKVEESDGIISSFEFKWGEKSKLKVPALFTNTYPDTEATLIK